MVGRHDIRLIEKMKGTFEKKPIEEEIKLKNRIERYCVASKEILKGEIINSKNIFFKRLKQKKKGIRAYDFEKIREKKSQVNYKKNDIIKT